MIFYIESENYLKNQYNNIIEDLNEREKRENKKIEIILDFLDKFNDYLENDNNEKNTKSYIRMLEALKKLSDNLRINKVNINNLKTFLNNLFSESFDITDEFKNKINEYNNLAIECKKNISESSDQFENFITEYIKNMTFSNVEQSVDKIDDNTNNINTESNEDIQEKSIKESTQDLKDNRVLLISETQKKVFLPYNTEDLEKILQKKKKYNSIQEVIDNEYTIPISKYKNPTLSRFKEAYKLMKNKEDFSVLESLDLAFEVTFNNSLNPAIITACKSLNELDLYLDCLETNSLDKFEPFEIKYEVLPLKQ